MKRDEKIYAYYKEGEYQFEGTITEIVECTGLKETYVQWLAIDNPRIRKRETVLEPVIDVDTFLCSLSIKGPIIKKLHAANIYTAEDLLEYTQDEVKEILNNITQFKSLMTYYNYFKKGLDDDDEQATDCNSTRHTA